MPALHLRCKNCGFVFPSGIAMDRKSFEVSSLSGNYHRCPKCGANNQYNKKDYFFKD